MLEDIRGVAEELRAGSIVFPLGLSHWDHQAVSNACLELASQMNAEFYAYLDMPYAQTDPAHLLRRMPHVVARVGALPEPAPYYARDPMVKRNAFLHYSSQFVPVSGALSFEASIGGAEQYWPISGAIGP
jgi:hypothetical protein